MQCDDEKNTVVLMGTKRKESSTFLPGEGISEGRWMLWLANGAWTQREEWGKYVSAGREAGVWEVVHFQCLKWSQRELDPQQWDSCKGIPARDSWDCSRLALTVESRNLTSTTSATTWGCLFFNTGMRFSEKRRGSACLYFWIPTWSALDNRLY